MTAVPKARQHHLLHRHDRALPEHGSNRARRSWAAFVAAVVAAVVVAVTVFSVIEGVDATPPAAAATTSTAISTVQSLYAQDLVSRINAERAARATLDVAVPQLAVDPTLTAYAQAWSAHLAAAGTVADPALSSCTGPATQECIMAANSGASGNGVWPGDGSDGMNGEYMASAPHRENMLGAAYTDVGVGVTCSGGQAWTVEVFGYTYGDVPSALTRQDAQNAAQGNPVPATPVVAGAPSGDPVYCPGQTIAADGTVTATGGQYPYPFRVASIAGRTQRPRPDGGHGGHGRRPGLLAGPLGRLGLRARRRGQLRLDGRHPAQRPHLPHRGHQRR